jgi:hypoxanthine phosphoribosyltransferase
MLLLICLFTGYNETDFKMPELIPVLHREEINQKVKKVASSISSDYPDHSLVLVGVLKGAFIFLSDLVRELTIPVAIDFIRVSSYGDKTSSSGEIKITKPLETDVKQKDVLIVEDIIDTGLTASFVIGELKSMNPNTVRICTFLDKHENRKTQVPVDYACKKIGSGFVVGYGLDYAEKYRELPDLYRLDLKG